LKILIILLGLLAFLCSSWLLANEAMEVQISVLEIPSQSSPTDERVGEGVSQVPNWVTWSNIASLGTLISALATLVIAWLTLISARHAKASAEAADRSAKLAENSIVVAKNAYIASERPWVTVTPTLSSDLVKEEHGINFGVDYAVKNVGNSPALNVHVVYEVVTLKVAQDQYSGARQRTDQIGESGAGEHMGVQLFPSEQQIIRWKSPLTNDEIEKGHNDWSRKNGYLPSFSIIGSVFYQSAFDAEIYRTGFKFNIYAFGVRGNPSISNVPDFEKTYSKRNLVLESCSSYKGTIN
jgi:hypothetical protein